VGTKKLYTTTGTLAERIEERQADLYVLLIIVFKTDNYNQSAGEKNYLQYVDFMEALDSTVRIRSEELDVRQVVIGDKPLTAIYTYV
jgi:hypothetical protein